MSAAIARIRKIGLIVFMICDAQFCEKPRQFFKIIMMRVAGEYVGAIDLNRLGGSVNRPYLFDLYEDVRGAPEKYGATNRGALPFRIYGKMLILKVLRDALGLFHLDLFGGGA